MKRDRSGDPPKSARELMAELAQDPEYVGRRQQRELLTAKHVKAYELAAEPVLRDLATVGLRLQAIGDLTESKAPYRSAVPILIRWLPQVQDPYVREDIVRTLSVPWAKPAAAVVLIDEFERAHDRSDTGLRWAIANGLEVVADDSVFERLARLVTDKAYGKDREMLALALGNMKNPHAADVLIGLLDDDEVAGHAVIALGRLKVTAARKRLSELMEHHRKQWVRNEAKKALARIMR